MTKIMLDPGHGGHDPGAQANGLVEKELVLSVAKKTENILQDEYSGANVQLTRTSDRFISLNERARMAVRWGADGFISIHFNAASAAASGTETFMHSSSNVAGLRNNLHNEILSELREQGTVNNRGLKAANFAVLRGTYRHMKTALTESLFLTNDRDARLLKRRGTLDAIARGHAQGIAKEFGLRRKAGTRSITTKGDDFMEPLPKNTIDAWMHKIEQWTDEDYQEGRNALSKDVWLKKAKDGTLTGSDLLRIQGEADKRGLR